MDGLLPFVIGGAIFTAVIGGLIGHLRGRVDEGVLLGFLLGPLGWLLVLMGKDARPKCPLCRGALETRAVARCKHCGGDLRLSAIRAARPAVDPLEAWERQQALEKPLRPIEEASRFSRQEVSYRELLDDPPEMTPLRRAAMRKRLGADD